MPLPKYKRNGLKKGDETPDALRLATPRCVRACWNGGGLRRLLARGVPALLLALPTSPAAAQRVLGPWEDATIAPRGMIRMSLGVHFGDWNTGRGPDGARQSLGDRFTLASVGPDVIPGMAGVGGDLSTLTGIAAPSLSLGALTTRVDVTEVRTPITFDVGLTDRLGLFAVVPYVKNRVHVFAAANTGGTSATLGLNPANGFPGARDRNGAVVMELTNAATTLEGELARCLGSVDMSCDVINADRPAATALAASSHETAAALARVYGTNAIAGSAYSPLAGGALHTAVITRLTDLGDQLTGFLGAAPAGSWVPSRPVAAPLMAADDLARLLGDPAYGIAAHPLVDLEHSHLGDVELGGKLLLVDTFGPGATTSDLPSRGAFRLALAGLVRLPTGQLDLPFDFTDVGTGDRQMDIEVRGLADVALGRRLWASTALRLGIQRPDELVRRIPPAPDAPFPELAREQRVQRDLGDFVEAEVAPRYVPNDAWSFSALYRYRSKSADTYKGTFDVVSVDGTPLSLDASVLGEGTSRTEQVLGLAVTLSSVRGFVLGESRWPLEVSLVHTRLLSGRGVPDQRAVGVTFRLYRPFRGANPWRPTQAR